MATRGQVKKGRSGPTKTRKFINAVVAGDSLRTAARKAGFPERSAVSAANVVAQRYADEIARRQAAIAERVVMKKAAMVNLLVSVLYTRLPDILSWDGQTLRLRAFSEIPEEFHAAIERIKQSADGSIEVTLVNRVEVAKEINRMLGWHAPVEVRHEIAPSFGLVMDVRLQREDPAPVDITPSVRIEDWAAGGDQGGPTASPEEDAPQ